MITLIGTGHVFDLSSAVLNLLYKKKPDLICLELDKKRFKGLKQQRYLGGKKTFDKSLPVIYRLLADFQENVARKYGTTVGNEMLAAEEYASTNNLPIELIDIDAQEILLKMWREMKLTEKIKLFISSIVGIFISKKKIEDELERLQNNYYEYIEEIGKKFPTIKKILIDDRNRHMANRLIELSKNYDNIVAIVGDGHIEGLSKILKSNNLETDIIRLKDLRNNTVDNKNNAHFTVEYKTP
jgi:pheromone shutdown protein TraB